MDLPDKERIDGEIVTVRLPHSGDASAGTAGPRKSATSCEPFSTASGSPSVKGDPCCCSQLPSAPLSTTGLRSGLQGSVDHLGHLVVVVDVRSAEAELIVQAFQF